MNKKKVLVAFDSQTMMTYVSQLLQESGYSVIGAANGADALDLIFVERPACALVYVDLPGINGWDLSRIIKNAPQLRKTSIIICSDEETGVYRFWQEKSRSDEILLLQKLDAQKLDETIRNVVAKNAANEESSEKTYDKLDRKDIIRLVADAGSRELFNLYIVQSAYDTGTKTFGVEQLADSMIQDLQGICNYDAVGIIVNDEFLIERYDYSDRIPKEGIQDFIHICHKDFEATGKERKNYDWERSTIKETRFSSESHTEDKLKSYEIFPKSEKSAVTVHIASCDADFFNSRIEERVLFFARTYAKILEKNIRFKKTSTAEEKMRNAFSRFVPSSVIDDIIAGNEQAQQTVGEKRQVAIMMSDIRNFTSISEINEPENVVNFLNYFFSTMGRIIKKYGGIIDKFMGDAIMALFGAPESFEDNGDRAAQAALEMMEAMKTIDTSLLEMPSGFKFEIGIGVHYGMPIVGSIGSEDKRDYTVIGDDVNLASRTEGLTKLYGIPIIVTDSIKHDMRKEYNGSRLLDKVKVKGKTESVEVFELMTEKEKYSKIFLDTYSKGIKQYLIGNFDSALEYFTQAEEIQPSDKASRVLKERCTGFIENPPENWDGSVSLMSK